MKIISKLIWLIVFVLFFGFALKNDQVVNLNFFLGYQTAAPLVILLLAFFLAGTVFCLLAMAPMVFRHRRDIHRHQKTIAEIEKERQLEQATATQAPAPDGVRN
ncbi:MAG: LapA family protein [Undibacterium sp.]|nr:LapA family protein [Undibacterium sp.]